MRPTIRRRSCAAVVGAAVLTATLVLGAAGPAAAGPEAANGSIVVVDVDGLLDPVSAGLVERSLGEAESEGVALLILAIDSSVDVDVDVARLAALVDEADVPVAAWVKGGGTARGGAVELVRAADIAAVASDASIEHTPDDGEPDLVRGREAVEAGAVDLVAPTLRDLVALLDGRTVSVGDEQVELDLGNLITESGEGADEGEVQVLPIRFRELGLTDQLQHALTSPFVAYLLLIAGLCLIVFEFFAIGIGVAAVVGAGLIVAAFVGFTHLPVNTVALGLVVGGVVAIAVDVQAGAARFWAAVGSAALLVGSFRLYDGPARLDPPRWQVVVVLVGALLFLLPGLAAVIRARFSTPTIGREWMVGEEGVAQVDFTPDGVVGVRGAPWRAVATRAAGIEAGDRVRVTTVQGLTLEVEPVEPVEPEQATEGGGSAPSG